MWLPSLTLKVSCFVGWQIVRVTGLVNNVPVHVPLLPLRLCQDFAADAVVAVKAARIAATRLCVVLRLLITCLYMFLCSL